METCRPGKAAKTDGAQYSQQYAELEISISEYRPILAPWNENLKLSKCSLTTAPSSIVNTRIFVCINIRNRMQAVVPPQ